MPSPASPAGAFTVERLPAPYDWARWDRFVLASAEVHPFATRAWLEPAAQATGAKLDLWAAAKGAEWIAAVAVSHRTRGGRKVHFGLPLAAYSPWAYRFRDDGHPASRTAERLRAAQAIVAELGKHYRLLSFLLAPSADDVRPMVWAGWRAVPRYTYILDTTRDLPVTDSVRRHIRKCRESGCTLSTVWDLDAFGSVFDATRERQGFGLRLAPEAFRALATQLHDAGLAWMASARSTDGRTLSSQIVLSVPGGRGAYMWTAGTHPEHLSSGVSAWLMVEIAAEARRRGHTFWDLCGADYPSIARFKSELGGTLTHYFQIQSSPSSLERVALWVRSLASARS